MRRGQSHPVAGFLAMALALSPLPVAAQGAERIGEVRLNAVTEFRADRVRIFSAPSGTRGLPVGEIRARERVAVIACIGELSVADAEQLSANEAAAYRASHWCKVRTRRGREGWVNARFLDLTVGPSPTDRALGVRD